MVIAHYYCNDCELPYTCIVLPNYSRYCPRCHGKNIEYITINTWRLNYESRLKR